MNFSKSFKDFYWIPRQEAPSPGEKGARADPPPGRALKETLLLLLLHAVGAPGVFLTETLDSRVERGVES